MDCKPALAIWTAWPPVAGQQKDMLHNAKKQLILIVTFVSTVNFRMYFPWAYVYGQRGFRGLISEGAWNWKGKEKSASKQAIAAVLIKTHFTFAGFK